MGVTSRLHRGRRRRQQVSWDVLQHVQEFVQSLQGTRRSLSRSVCCTYCTVLTVRTVSSAAREEHNSSAVSSPLFPSTMTGKMNRFIALALLLATASGQNGEIRVSVATQFILSLADACYCNSDILSCKGLMMCHVVMLCLRSFALVNLKIHSANARAYSEE